MEDLFSDENRSYPEVSYVLVDNCIKGIAGIGVGSEASSCPALPEDVEWLELDSVTVKGNYFKIRHEGNTKTTLTNLGRYPTSWTAMFYGHHEQLIVNGEPVECYHGEKFGQPVTYTWVELRGPNQTTTVEVAKSTHRLQKTISQDRIKLYPNPAKTEITIHADQIITEIQIVSFLGKVVGQEILNTSEITMNINSFSPGQYMIRIKTTKGISFKWLTVL